jgi:hypothetical protein
VHAETFREQPLSNEKQQAFETLARESLARQSELEQTKSVISTCSSAPTRPASWQSATDEPHHHPAQTARQQPGQDRSDPGGCAQLLAEQGVAALSIYSVAERAQIPPSSVYHFFASVPALLEALTADVHRAFREALSAPIDSSALSTWHELSRLIEQRMLDIYNEDAAARQLILAQHGLSEVVQADRQHDMELGDLMHKLFDQHFSCR